MRPDTAPELLGKRDNDALRPADVGQAVRLPVLHFANQLGPVGPHVRNERVETVDGRKFAYSGDMRMELRREGKAWKIVGGESRVSGSVPPR